MGRGRVPFIVRDANVASHQALIDDRWLRVWSRMLLRMGLVRHRSLCPAVMGSGLSKGTEDWLNKCGSGRIAFPYIRAKGYNRHHKGHIVHSLSGSMQHKLSNKQSDDTSVTDSRSNNYEKNGCGNKKQKYKHTPFSYDSPCRKVDCSSWTVPTSPWYTHGPKIQCIIIYSAE